MRRSADLADQAAIAARPKQNAIIACGGQDRFGVKKSRCCHDGRDLTLESTQQAAASDIDQVGALPGFTVIHHHQRNVLIEGEEDQIIGPRRQALSTQERPIEAVGQARPLFAGSQIPENEIARVAVAGVGGQAAAATIADSATPIGTVVDASVAVGAEQLKRIGRPLRHHGKAVLFVPADDALAVSGERQIANLQVAFVARRIRGQFLAAADVPGDQQWIASGADQLVAGGSQSESGNGAGLSAQALRDCPGRAVAYDDLPVVRGRYQVFPGGAVDESRQLPFMVAPLVLARPGFAIVNVELVATVRRQRENSARRMNLQQRHILNGQGADGRGCMAQQAMGASGIVEPVFRLPGQRQRQFDIAPLEGVFSRLNQAAGDFVLFQLGDLGDAQLPGADGGQRLRRVGGLCFCSRLYGFGSGVLGDGCAHDGAGRGHLINQADRAVSRGSGAGNGQSHLGPRCQG